MMVAMPNRDASAVEQSIESPPETVQESTNEATTVSATVEPKNDPPAESVAVYMPPHMLAHMYCDSETTRYALDGIQVDPARGRICITDGRILAIICADRVRRFPITEPVIISRESIKTALRLAKVNGRYIFLRYDPARPASERWTFEGRRFSNKDAVAWSMPTEIVEGRFPNVDNVMTQIGDDDQVVSMNPGIFGIISDHVRASNVESGYMGSESPLRFYINPDKQLAKAPVRMRLVGKNVDNDHIEVDLVAMPLADENVIDAFCPKPRKPAVHVCMVEFSGCSAQPQFANRLDAIKWGLDQAKRYRPDQYFMTLGRLSADHPGFTSEDHLLAISELLTGFDRLAVCELQSAESAASLLRDALGGERASGEEN